LRKPPNSKAIQKMISLKSVKRELSIKIEEKYKKSVLK